MTDIKRLTLDFERLAMEYHSHGMTKPLAERAAMRTALQGQGWTVREATEMTAKIFEERKGR